MKYQSVFILLLIGCAQHRYNTEPFPDETLAVALGKKHAAEDYLGNNGWVRAMSMPILAMAGPSNNPPYFRLAALKGASEMYIISYRKAYLRERARLETRDARGCCLFGGFVYVFVRLVRSDNE